MDTIEGNLLLYKLFYITSNSNKGRMEEDTVNTSNDYCTAADFHLFLQRITKNEDITLKEITPIFHMVDKNGQGLVDWKHFGEGVSDILKTMNIEDFMEINYDMGFGRSETIVMHEFLANTFLVDYDLECPVFTDLAKNIRNFEENRIKTPLDFVYGTLESSSQDELKSHAIGMITNFQEISNALNSLNNAEGFKEVSKTLQIIKFADHPKDLSFLSQYFNEFFSLYNKAALFPQTFNLPNIATTSESAIEAAKIIFFIYQCLKLKNSKFNFLEFLKIHNLLPVVMGEKVISGLMTIIGNSSDEVFSIYLSALAVLLQNCPEAVSFMENNEFLVFLLNILNYRSKPECYLPIAFFFYNMAMSKDNITNKNLINILGSGALKLMTLNDETLFVYGLRTIAILVQNQHPDSEFLELFKKILEIIQKEKLRTRIECLKFIKKCARKQDFAKIFVESNELMKYIGLKIISEEKSSEVKLCAQILWEISMRDLGYELVEKGFHKVLVDSLAKNSYLRMDCMICVKSMVKSSQMAIGPLVEVNILETLLQVILDYREKSDVLENIYNFEDYFVNLPLASLASEILGQIIESGFVSDGNDNTFKDLVTGKELFSFKIICDQLVEDEVLIKKGVVNPLVMHITSKNIVETLLQTLHLYKKIYYKKNMEDEFKAATYLQETLISKFKEVTQNPSIYISNFKKIKSSSEIRIDFRCYSSINYPHGDNRTFYIKGPHDYNDIKRSLDESYGYMKPYIVLFRDKTGETVTIDSDYVYQKMLIDRFGKQSLGGEVKLFIKSLRDGDRNKRGGGIFGRSRSDSDDFHRTSSGIGFGFGGNYDRRTSWFFD